MRRSDRKLIILAAIAALVTLPHLALSAQSDGLDLGLSGEPATDVSASSSEFGRFVLVLQEIQQIQSDASTEIDRLFATSSLDERRFREMHRRMESEDEDAQDRLGEMEKQEFAELLTGIDEIQRAAETEVVAAIEEADLTVDRFNALILAVREDRTLRQAIQRRLHN